MPISAYLNLFDDWDLLEPSLRSVEPFVDEIVVVDGAYRWMAPMLEALGRDPTRSDNRVYEALAPFAAKTRLVTGLWDDEGQKRAAGYAACSHRWILRIDADEILFFDPAAFERLLRSGHAVGEIEIPLYLAPGWVRRRQDPDGGPGAVERLPAFFDRRQVGAREHLAHLWLFLTRAEQAELVAASRDRVHPECYAFAAHLTQWRAAEGATNRARFYVANYLREHRPDELDGMSDPAFAAKWISALSGHVIVAGLPEMDGFCVRPTPLAAEQDATLVAPFNRKMASLHATNADFARTGRTIAAGEFSHVDLSTAHSAAAIGRHDRAIRFVSSQPIVKALAEVITLRVADDQPLLQKQAAGEVVPHGAGSEIAVEIPTEPEPGALLRRVLRLRCWNSADTKWIDLKVKAA